ncbi:MAG TPA: hypothetical protein VJ994_13460 [Paracoccaceae bacterium]|nr:hypothetical protein [Paracoccaceae bacterium]
MPMPLNEIRRLHRRPARLWRLGRRLAPAATALLLACGAVFGLLAPLLESAGNARVWTFAYIPVLAAPMLGMIVWLALFSAVGKPTPRRAPAMADEAATRRPRRPAGH